tara:strand:+ start:2540 stop:2713 length:174 start_codon:yes stop_codon:yes gene_type:complete
MFQRLWKRCQSWLEKIEWVDDPEGECLLKLEQRVDHLEKDVAHLKQLGSDIKLQPEK